MKLIFSLFLSQVFFIVLALSGGDSDSEDFYSTIEENYTELEKILQFAETTIDNATELELAVCEKKRREGEDEWLGQEEWVNITDGVDQIIEEDLLIQKDVARNEMTSIQVLNEVNEEIDRLDYSSLKSYQDVEDLIANYQDLQSGCSAALGKIKQIDPKNHSRIYNSLTKIFRGCKKVINESYQEKYIDYYDIASYQAGMLHAFQQKLKNGLGYPSTSKKEHFFSTTKEMLRLCSQKDQPCGFVASMIKSWLEKEKHYFATPLAKCLAWQTYKSCADKNWPNCGNYAVDYLKIRKG